MKRARSKSKHPQPPVPPPELRADGTLKNDAELRRARIQCDSAYLRFRHKEDIATALERFVKNGTVASTVPISLS